jgi:peptidoglycan/LPS O-acetylase OafA/YrhL
MKKTYTLIQCLRAIAAGAVVAHHAGLVYIQRLAPIGTVRYWLNGMAGVDIFFVISGFVIVISSVTLMKQEDAAKQFIWLRLRRIIPLYWIVTIFKIIMIRMMPSSAINGLGSSWHILASFLFVPSRDANGGLNPVVTAGWTLELEMMFYAIYSIALWLRANPLKFVSPILVGLAIMNRLRLGSWPAFYCNPIVIEFVFGMILGGLASKGKQSSVRVSLVLALVGGVLLFVVPPFSLAWRFLAWGLPAMAIVWAAVGLETRIGAKVPGWFLELGEASYAIYLIQVFSLPICALIIAHLFRGTHYTEPISYALGIVSGLLAGLIAYRLVDRPIMRLLRKKS